MSEQLYYAVFSTTAGWIGILGSGNGLRRVTLPQHSEQAAGDRLGDRLLGVIETPGHFTDVIERFRAYYAGQRVEFPDRPDFTGATPFRQAVWQATRLIPYGETRSYAWVAAAAGKPGAARAAGQALAANPLPVIVPCHRVLAADGGPGGFSGGLQMKEYLLRLEAEAPGKG
jgi:methylated-DNA-[protein]-cysteine S-methyltransferase